MNQQIRVVLKGYDHKILDRSSLKIVKAAKATGVEISGPIPLPNHKRVFSVIRSPHRHKDSQEQFEMRTHKRLIIIADPNPKTIDVLTRLQLPSGLDVQIKLKQ